MTLDGGCQMRFRLQLSVYARLCVHVPRDTDGKRRAGLVPHREWGISKGQKKESGLWLFSLHTTSILSGSLYTRPIFCFGPVSLFK